MSNQFYKYLANNVIKYFRSRKVKSGDKFNIQFESDEQVRCMYDALAQEGNAEVFIYNITDELEYKTFSVNIDGIKIILASTCNNVSNDFLVRLRNLIGNESVIEFKYLSILFIHNTTLDSLIKGTESLQKEGMPLHTKCLIRDINTRLENKDLRLDVRYIVESALDEMSNNILEDNSSIFQYEDILRILDNGKIEKFEYSKFGLFYDENMVDDKDKTAIKKRIAENMEMFSSINWIHQYEDPALELKKFFSSKGAQILADSDWKSLTYNYVKSFKIKTKRSKIKLINIESDLNIWIKPDMKSPSKRRDIVIFNKDKFDSVGLCIEFDKDLDKNHFTVDKNIEVNMTETKRKVIFRISLEEPKMTFAKVIYSNNSVKYEFRICVVHCEEKILYDMKSNYSVGFNKKRGILITNTSNDTIIINPEGINEIRSEINKSDKEIDLNEDERIILEFDLKQEEEEEKFVKINILYNQSIITIAKQKEKERSVTISGIKICKLKRERRESFKYLHNNKIVQGTSEYTVEENFKKSLSIENKIIEEKAIHGTVLGTDFNKIELEIDYRIKKAYYSIIDYYRVNNLLPSLTYYDKDLIDISKDYINSILNVFEELKNEEVLSSQQEQISKIGTVYKADGEQEIFLTPLHPINIAYQLVLNDAIRDEEVEENILKLMSSRYLVPYMYKAKGELYTVIDQNHSPEWTYYVSHDKSRYRSSRDYVAKLTREKISEFIDHFTYLFRVISKSTIKIKLINLGDCKEVLIGIFDYYTEKLNSGEDIHNLISIDIYMYDEKNSINVFEEIAFYDSIENLKEYLNIRLKSKNYFEDNLLNLFRNKVRFYRRDKNKEIYEYSHLTFYQMNKDINLTSSVMDDIKTGVALNGLISGVPSIYIKDTYRTGFGSKFMNKDTNELLNIAMKFNSITKSVGTGDPFNSSISVTTAINENNDLLLNKIYQTSHWVTFIDPKVDLNFFKNDKDSNDLLIIHYSDQYTTSAGYDAITVTRKSEQYKFVIEEFLKSKGIEFEEDTVPMLINYFNAVNGDWLLRLISRKSQFPREKLSILSAIKVGLAYFYHPSITWIPISLEEILRVSGGTGLSQSESIFTVRNLTGGIDSYSDDLLFVGIEKKWSKVKVYFYPVEVKIGENNENVIIKAIDQANKTRNLIEKCLIEDESDSNKFTKSIYRNFIIQLVITSAEKMSLYNIWEEQNWEDIINSDIRTKLLSDDYEISKDLDEFIGRGAVISFKKGTYHNDNIGERYGITILDLSEQSGYNNIVKNLEEIKDKYIKGNSDFDVQKMLITRYVVSSIINTSIHKDDNYISDVSMLPNNIENLDYSDRLMKIVFGNRKDNDKELVWDPTNSIKVPHPNTGIIGTMGTGKTQFTKSLVTQIHREQNHNINGKPIGILIFDYKGDYIKDDFVDATNAKVYEIHHLPYNPLTLIIPERGKPLLPIHTANSLKETIAKAFGLGPKQEVILRELIMKSYEKKGIKKDDENTWVKSCPTMQDVLSIYLDDREIKKDDKLYAALSSFNDFEIFEPNSEKTKNLFDLINGITVINLSYYDSGIQNLVVAITLDLFYSQMKALGSSDITGNGEYRQLNKMILVDEADNFLSRNFTSIKNILKEGREFGVGTILSTQLLSHFSTSENEYQNYISTWIIHNVSDINNKDIRYIFNSKNKSEEDNIYNKIKNLAKHESLVKMPSENSPIYIRDKAFWELNK